MDRAALRTETIRHSASACRHRYPGTCPRCRGLMVGQFCIDLFNTGDLEIEALRCVQCGNIVDPVILRHRLTQQEAVTAKNSSVPFYSIGR